MFRTKTTPETVAEKVRSATADAGAVATERLAEVKERVVESPAAEKAAARFDAASERVNEAADAARARAAEAADEARARVAEAAEDAKARSAEASERARALAREAAETAKVRAYDAGEKAKSTWMDVVLPYVGTIVGTATTVLKQARARAEDAKERAADAAAPRVEAAREAYGESTHRATDALAVLKGDAVAKHRTGNGGRNALILVGLAAAGAAAYAVFRSKKQADDPWAAPLTDPVITPEADVNTNGQSLKDKAAGAVETAKDKAADLADSAKEKAAELADTAKEKASDLAARGQAAVADAKDHTGELSAESAQEDEPAASLDGDVVDGIDVGATSVDGSEGEVSAVGSIIGSDAVVGEMPQDDGIDLSEAELTEEHDAAAMKKAAEAADKADDAT